MNIAALNGSLSVLKYLHSIGAPITTVTRNNANATRNFKRRKEMLNFFDSVVFMGLFQSQVLSKKN
jgi:beta-phosphoglucomutase-like phosphatase (HAD superfamily)